ncbi:MAG: response regulator transcription factor, partial [Chitinophagales bacterium]|nr:response regulator transcription factor [Chitinophagales bacterium]
MHLQSCIIVEDEPLAAELLAEYIRQIPFLKLEAICTDALFALEKMHEKKIDVLFLDLHLPKLKGFDFLQTLKDPPQVIITTAYHQYAIEGYTMNVVDYLLKPIEFSRFLRAVNKLKTPPAIPAEKREEVAGPDSYRDEKFYFFNVDKKNVKIYADEILYIESGKEYVKIVTPEKTITTKFQIGEMEKYLNDVNFMRIHRSFIIAKNKIESYSASEIEIRVAGGIKKIPIG